MNAVLSGNMNIDSHQHFWHYNPQRDSWITAEMATLKRDFLPEQLIEELRANGIQGCVAVQADQSEQETELLLNLAAKHPSMIRGVVGWVDLLSPKLPERLDHYAGFKKLRGVRHIVQSEPDDRFMLRPDFRRGIVNLKDFNLTFDILIYPRQLPAAIELVREFPEQKFVLDHMAKPRIRAREIEDWSKQIRSLATNRNVYCKVSGLVTEGDWRDWRADDLTPYLDVAFDAFGPDRLMFGSDWPVCLLAATYRQVRDLVADYTSRLGAEVQEKILGTNAAQFYRLELK